MGRAFLSLSASSFSSSYLVVVVILFISVMKRTLEPSSSISPTYFLFGHHEDEYESSGIFFTPTTDLGRAFIALLREAKDAEVRSRMYHFILDSDDDDNDDELLEDSCKLIQLPGLTPTSVLGTVVHWEAASNIAAIPVQVEFDY